MTHKHFYILDKNSFGRCKCGATKQFPTEKKLKVKPNIVPVFKYDPDAWLQAGIHGVFKERT